MRIFLALFIAVFLFSSNAECVTFYGEVSRGYKYVEVLGGGYGVYVPQSFDPDQRPVLIFAFGRTQNNLMLTQEQLRDYALLWADEAEKRGAVVIAPFWEPMVVSSNQHVEKFYLGILRDVKSMYHIAPDKVLLAGVGLGGRFAFALAALYPEQFHGLVVVGQEPMGDRVLDDLLNARLRAGLPPEKLPPLLLIYGPSGAALIDRQKTYLEQKGVHVDTREIGGMRATHDPQINPVILDWFESLAEG